MVINSENKTICKIASVQFDHFETLWAQVELFEHIFLIDPCHSFINLCVFFSVIVENIWHCKLWEMLRADGLCWGLWIWMSNSQHLLLSSLWWMFFVFLQSKVNMIKPLKRRSVRHNISFISEEHRSPEKQNHLFQNSFPCITAISDSIVWYMKELRCYWCINQQLFTGVDVILQSCGDILIHGF